jgi:hypothetical protein
MNIVQKINCHLSTDETMFAQLLKLEGQSFAAQLSPICARGARQLQGHYQWLVCPDKKTAVAVFRTIIDAVARQCEQLGDRRLVMISNPDGGVLVSKAEQKNIVGVDVAIVATAPEGLIKP